MQPDILLPAQQAARRAKIPEVWLLLCVLEQAIQDYQRHRYPRDRTAAALRDHAAEWMREAPSTYVFCFANVCEVLGLDPDAVRAVVLR